MKPNTTSAPAAWLLTGQVMHERLRPVRNRFVYPVFAVRINLARLSELTTPWFGVNCWRPWSIRTRDYGPRNGGDLQLWIQDILAKRGVEADGDVWLQTFPRVLGFVFNPVSFWRCHNAAGALIAVLAEVNNTFGDTHHYLLTAKQGGVIGQNTLLQCEKVMHVSPFCPVEGHYTFRFRESNETSFVGIDYFDANGLLIKTSIGGHKMPLTAGSARQSVLKQPLLTVGVVIKIHWQALRLWWRKVPFHRQPAPPLQTMTEGDER